MFFLGILTDQSMHAGITSPDFVLCHNGNAKERHWMVYMTGTVKLPPRVLVTTMEGHDDLVQFLVSHRACTPYSRRKRKKAYKKRYTPKGAIFWYECDIYGARTGPCYFVKRVGDFVDDINHTERDFRVKILNESLERQKDVPELLTENVFAAEIPDWDEPPWRRQPLPERRERDSDWYLKHFGDRLNRGGNRKERNETYGSDETRRGDGDEL